MNVEKIKIKRKGTIYLANIETDKQVFWIQ